MHTGKRLPQQVRHRIHDLLIEEFGYIFEKPLIKKNEGEISSIEFKNVFHENDPDIELIDRLKPLIQTKNKFDISLSKRKYAKIFNEYLQTKIADLKLKKSDPSSAQALCILESIDPLWFSPNNIVLIGRYPFIKYWGIKNKYLPFEEVHWAKKYFGLIKQTVEKVIEKFVFLYNRYKQHPSSDKKKILGFMKGTFWNFYFIIVGFIVFAYALSLRPDPSKTINTINSNNWSYHPEIIEVRNSYNRIKDLITNNNYSNYTSSKRIYTKFDQHQAMPLLYIDNQDRVFLITYTDGSIINRQINYYFDENERLRFLLIKSSAPNGSQLEEKVWIMKDGETIWDQKEITGPDYNWNYYDNDWFFIKYPRYYYSG